jgi:hypothetical protein
MPSIEFDLGYLQAGLDSLEAYLISKSLFWPIGAQSPSGDPAYPRLTLGNLLFSQVQLNAKTLLPYQSDRLKILNARISDVHSRWPVAWERKAKREFTSRLRQWQQYLIELHQEPLNFIDFFRNEVRLRFLLDLLASVFEPLEGQTSLLLIELDEFLQKVWVQDDFLWDKTLARDFNKDRYWYLWGRPEIENLQKAQIQS